MADLMALAGCVDHCKALVFFSYWGCPLKTWSLQIPTPWGACTPSGHPVGVILAKPCAWGHPLSSGCMSWGHSLTVYSKPA